MQPIKTGALIAEARKEKSLTQKDLAQALHVSVQAVSKWERGLNFPDIALMEPLAELLELTVSELMAGERNAPAGEELVRTSVQMGKLVSGKARRWRRLFLALALVVVCLGGFFGYRWVKENTDWLPQRETVIVPRESTDSELLATKIASGASVYLFDITYADGLRNELLQMELWTHEGLVQTWQLACSKNAPDNYFPRKRTIGIGYDVKFGENGEPDLFSYGIALNAGVWSGSYDDVPYFAGGFGFSPLTRTTTVDPEHGIVLGCFTLDPTGQGQWRTANWCGNVAQPEVDPGEAYLLLRMIVD